jgi:hypothetical protein
MNKEKLQVVALSVLLAGIVGVIIFFNFDRLKPHASGGSALIQPQIAKLQLGTADTKELFGRSDYRTLQEFGAVPVRVMGLGNEKPFSIAETAAQ